MINRAEIVRIERHPKTWWDHKQRIMQNYVQLRGKDNELFYNENGDIRIWKKSAYAKAFLRRVVERWGGSGYIFVNEKGRETLIGVTEREVMASENPDLYGPHKWHKRNAVTLDDGHGGLYDLWQCDLCRQEVKRYGLAGRPTAGVCSENLTQLG